MKRRRSLPHRIVVDEDAGRVRVEIPCRKRVPSVLLSGIGALFLTVFGLLQAAFLVFLLVRSNTLRSSELLFGSALAAFMLLMDFLLLRYVVLQELAWQLFGCERIETDGEELTIHVDARWFGRSQRYPVRDVKDIRLADGLGFEFYAWRFKDSAFFSGRVEFDYRGTSVRFGKSLTAEEAQTVVRILRKHHAA